MKDIQEKSKLPKWFDGAEYKKGAEVTNPISGQAIEIDGPALSMYDFLWGCVMTNRTNHKDFQKGMSWFRVNYPEAYMVLLD